MADRYTAVSGCYLKSLIGLCHKNSKFRQSTLGPKWACTLEPSMKHETAAFSVTCSTAQRKELFLTNMVMLWWHQYLILHHQSIKILIKNLIYFQTYQEECHTRLQSRFNPWALAAGLHKRFGSSAVQTSSLWGWPSLHFSRVSPYPCHTPPQPKQTATVSHTLFLFTFVFCQYRIPSFFHCFLDEFVVGVEVVIEA